MEEKDTFSCQDRIQNMQAKSRRWSDYVADESLKKIRETLGKKGKIRKRERWESFDVEL